MQTITIILIAFFCLLFLGGTLVLLVDKYNTFRRELDYVNSEIRRAGSKEKKYWQKKKRRLWLGWLPFYNTFRERKKRRK